MLTTFLPKSIKDVLNVPVGELSDDQLSGIMVDLGLGSLHPDLRLAAVQLLQDRGVSTAADAIQHPEALKQLSYMVRSFKPQVADRSCDFCGGRLLREGAQFFCQQCGIHH